MRVLYTNFRLRVPTLRKSKVIARLLKGWFGIFPGVMKNQSRQPLLRNFLYVLVWSQTPQMLRPIPIVVASRV